MALVLALPAAAAHAAPVDPAAPGGPEYAAGCPVAADCAPPTDTTAVAAGWYTTAPVTVKLEGADEALGSGIAAMEYAIGSDEPQSVAPGFDVPFAADGVYTLAHRAVDTDGNKSAWVIDTVQVDTTQPGNVTAALASDWRPSGAITVAGTDATSGVALVQWRIDGGATESGPAGATAATATVPAGEHTIETWVVDVAGLQSDPRTDTVKVDLADPLDATAIPSAWQTTTPVALTLTGSDPGAPTTGAGVTAMEYRINGAALQTTGPGGPLSFGADGVYLIAHAAVDGSGRKSAAVTDTLRIDTTKPTDTSTVSTAWTDGNVYATVSGSDATSGVQTVRWRIDGGATQSGAAGSAVTITGDGTHTLETQVVDRADQASTWRPHSVRIDTGPPTDQTAVSSAWQNGDATITVRGYDDGSGVGRLEWMHRPGTTGPWTTGASTAATATVTITGEGQHTLLTQVTDALGHKSAWKTHTVRIDRSAPANTTAPLDAAAWHGRPVAVEVKGGDGESGLAWMAWSVDGATTQTGPAGSVVTIDGDGTHTLETVAVDVAGNQSGPRTDTIRIDTVKPTDVTNAPAQIAYGAKIAIDGSDTRSGIDVVEWEIDGAAGSGPDATQVTLGGRGAHTLRHRVVDRAGNASAWKQDTVTVNPALNGDTLDPTDRTAPPSAWQTSAPVTVTVDGDDAQTAVERVEWRGDGGSPQSGPAGSTFAVTGEGVHYFETRVWDVAGNDSGWTERSVRIDTVAPGDDTAVAAWQNTRDVTLAAGDATSKVERIEWWIDGGAKQTWTAASPQRAATRTVTLTADGEFTLEHRVVDAAGNVSARRTDTVRIDRQAPVDATPTAPAGWSPSAWEVTPSGTDTGGSGVAEVRATLDGVTVTDFPITIAQDGVHTLATQVVDRAGTATAWRTQTVRIDRTAPVDATPAAPEGWRSAPWSTAPAAVDGDGSGVASVEWKLGADGPVSTAPDVLVEAEGESVLHTRATDVAGLVSEWREQTVRIDRTDPTAALECGDGAWTTAAAVCTVTAADIPSGLAALTFTGGGAADRAVTSGAQVGVEADGTWPVALVAVDRAGRTTRAERTVKVDRTPPTATLACTPADGALAYACTATAADAMSGLAGLRWRVDGGDWQAPGAGGTFTVPSGRVEVQATDVAGLTGSAPVATLAARETARVRTRRVAVARRGVKGADALIGAFELRTRRVGSRPGEATADVRPLMLGAGRYRVTVRIASGQLGARRTRSVTFRRTGTTPRMGVALSGVTGKVAATLVVERRAGKRWKRIAAVSTSL